MTGDLQRIRELGATLAPPTDQPPATLRDRVLAAAAPSRPAERHRRWSATAALACAAVAAAVVVVSTVVASRPAPESDQLLLQVTQPAAGLLLLAARAAAGAPDATAQPGRFVFTESVAANETVDRGGWQSPAGLPTLVRVWRAAEGSHIGRVETRPVGTPEAVWQEGPSPGCWESPPVNPSDTYSVFRSCAPGADDTPPTDPDGMLAHLYGQDRGAGADERAWERAANALYPGRYPPAVRAAVFAAMARIPGASVRTGAVDMAGRSGVAVGHTSGRGGPTEIVLDPTTHEYLGTNRSVAVDGLPGTDRPVVVEIRNAVQRIAIVDDVGDVP